MKERKVSEQRKEEVFGQLRELGKEAYEAIEQGRFPEITLPSRSVKNIVYDEALRQFVLGAASVKRSSHNVKHIRPYTQLLWLAFFSQQLVREKKTSTLRDVYYSAQAYNTEFADQAESDETITDLETALMKAREDFNIYPEERSSIFGDLTVEYTIPGYEGKRLDLTSHPDGVMIGPALTTAEFADTDAEMVIAIEKGGLFTRFIEENVHKKHKAILINTAGQPPRSTRYIIKRLNQELKLPTYILCDSVAGDEPVLVRKGGEVSYLDMEEFADRVFGGKGDGSAEWVSLEGEGWETLAFDPSTLKVEWMPVTVAYRHRVDGPLHEVEFEDGRRVKVTKNHSLFALKDGVPTPIAASELKAGDFALMPVRLPALDDPGSTAKVYDVLKYLDEPATGFVEADGIVRYVSAPKDSGVPRFLELDANVAWILGFWVAEGCYDKDRYIKFSQGMKNRRAASDLIGKIRRSLGVDPTVSIAKRRVTTEATIVICRKALKRLFEKGFGALDRYAAEKEIPHAIWSLPAVSKLEFVKGLMAGDGHVDLEKGVTLYSTSSPRLASQLSYLLRSLGFDATVTVDPHLMNTVYIHGYSLLQKGPWLPVKSFPELFEVSGFGLFQRPQEKVSIGRLLPRVKLLAASFREIQTTGRTAPGVLGHLTKNGYATGRRGKYELTRKGMAATLTLERAIKLLAGDILPVRATSVVEIPGSASVYDITVPKGRSFVAGQNCTLTHNSDPWGAHIAMVIVSGSANAAHLRELTTPDAKWIGVWASDINKYKLPHDKLNDLDIKRLYELQKDPRYNEKLWKDEIDCFLKYKKKAELEAFARYGLTYIVDKYLPDKLEAAKSL